MEVDAQYASRFVVRTFFCSAGLGLVKHAHLLSLVVFLLLFFRALPVGHGVFPANKKFYD